MKKKSYKMGVKFRGEIVEKGEKWSVIKTRPQKLLNFF